MTKFCECGRIAEYGEYCDKHSKKPPKPKRKKGVQFSGDSQWRQEMGMFQAKEGR